MAIGARIAMSVTALSLPASAEPHGAYMGTGQLRAILPLSSLPPRVQRFEKDNSSLHPYLFLLLQGSNSFPFPSD